MAMLYVLGMGLRVRVMVMLHIHETGVVSDEKLWLHIFDVVFVLASPFRV